MASTTKWETRPWGRFEVLYADETMWLKRLVIAPGQSLSLQYHHHRAEYWQILDPVLATLDEEECEMYPGEFLIVGCGQVHRLSNTGQTDAVVIEWAYGRPDESDIVRLEDNYGR